MKSTTLYYREGSSDKIYQVAIQPQENLFVVNFAFGRRGSTLNTGTKTQSPVKLEDAEKIFEKLVKEKMAKGYSPGADGTPYQHTNKEERVSGYLPQLLNPIDEDQLETYLTDPAWWLQEKYDGKRLMLQKQGSSVTGINRKGLIVGVPENIVQQALRIEDDFVFDGEAVSDFYYSFDILKFNDANTARDPYIDRFHLLQELILPTGVCDLRCSVTAQTEKQKRDHLALLKSVRAEGVVLKRSDAPYAVGRPASGGSQLKCKFYATASFIVGAVNKRRSVLLMLMDGGKQVSAGNVTVPANQAVPKVGDVVEVRYLYAFNESGSVYQPVFLGKRDDVTSQECVVNQLKYRASAEQDDDSGDQ